MSKDFVVLPFQDEFGCVFRIYSADFKTFYGDFYNEREVYNKLKALRLNRLNGVCV